MGVEPKENFDLSLFTTFGIGGLAQWAQEITSISDLESASEWARNRKLPTLFVGSGSNILFGEQGFAGLLIINRIAELARAGTLPPPGGVRSSSAGSGTTRWEAVRAGGGVNLIDLIGWCNRHGLAGLERMYGIPGTVAGAVVGNAGAYGQEIQQSLVEVTVWTRQGLQTLTQEELAFHYRHSILKERKDWMVVDCLFRLQLSEEPLEKISADILQAREVKYPPALRCPGSFFKNVEVSSLSTAAMESIPPDFITHGKVPAGRLLDAVGACGARRGEAMIASYHGNLFINLGGATSADVLWLAAEYGSRVQEKFHVQFEPEVLIIDGAWTQAAPPPRERA